MPRWDDEQFSTKVPPEDILCATCIHRLKPVIVGDFTQDRSGFSYCDKFNPKPTGVLWEHADCEYYEKEE